MINIKVHLDNKEVIEIKKLSGDYEKFVSDIGKSMWYVSWNPDTNSGVSFNTTKVTHILIDQ